MSNVLESWMSEQLREQRLLVEHRVYKVRIVMQRTDEARVEYLEHHPHHFFDDCQFLRL
jgi:hypothetical protein